MIDALATPGTAFKAFSTRPTQDAHVMPSTLKLRSTMSETGFTAISTAFSMTQASRIDLPAMARSSGVDAVAEPDSP